MKFKVGLQPFTIAEEMNQDFLGSFEKVAKLGYQGVEMGYPLQNITIERMTNHFEKVGLEIISCHVMIDALTNDLEAVIDYLKSIHTKNLVLSYHVFHSKQDVLDSAVQFNEIGLRCKQQGIQFSYHNHDHEFNMFDGEKVLDLLIRETDPALVNFELDTYWIKKSGADPVSYLEALKNRCPLLHIKDMEGGDDQFFAEIGEGILDFNQILQAANRGGTEWIIVEQDKCRTNPMESIEISLNHLLAMEVVK